MKTASFKDYKEYLLSKVDKDLYVLGAQGEDLLTLLPKICEMAGVLAKVDQILTLAQKRLMKGYTVRELCAFDCSGLIMKYLIDHGIYKHDMTADGIYNAIPDKVAVKDVQEGDFVVYGSYKTKTEIDSKTGKKVDKRVWSVDHIGSVINDTEVVEARGSAYGVVKTKIADRPWEKAVRPDWWSDIKPKPEKYVLTRELYYDKDNLIKGEDVKQVQERLNSLKYACGTADGIFGRKTDLAVKTFQYDNDLKQDGVVGKNTAEALGFKWKG
jgi:hypothetical protein